jgi:hypothetical protein
MLPGFKKHGINQAITRQFTPERIAEIIRKGSVTEKFGRYGKQFRYTLGKNTVVVDISGRIITMFGDSIAGKFAPY